MIKHLEKHSIYIKIRIEIKNNKRRVIDLRVINGEEIVQAISEICKTINYELSQDVVSSIENASKTEKSEIGREILGSLLENIEIAKTKRVPICQDTGMAVFFVEIGQDVFVDGNLTDAINKGVKIGYEEGYLRKSVVGDPLIRKNTGDNTPAVIHYSFVSGDKLNIKFAPKGFGSENMSKLKMLKPSDGIEGVKEFVIETVELSGSNPCPPIVVGVGIGGTMDKACQLAKYALTRSIGTHHHAKHIKELEEELLEEINKLGIGPQGLGGTTTALAVNVETFPTHIAGLPLAVNINCHAARHIEIEI